MVRVRERRWIAIALTGALILLALAGCFSVSTDLGSEKNSSLVQVTEWPPGAPFILVQFTPTKAHEQTVEIHMNLSVHHEYNDASSISVDPRIETEPVPAWQAPRIVDLLEDTPGAGWKSIGSFRYWDQLGVPSHTTGTNAHLGVNAGGERIAFYHDTDLSSSSYGASSSSPFHTKAQIDENPVRLLVYAPHAEPSIEREIELNITVPAGVDVKLLEGTENAILDTYRKFPLGAGHRVEASLDAPVSPPGSQVRPLVSQAEGTPIRFETTGTPLLFVQGLTDGVGTSHYSYTPPESDPVEVEVEVVHDGGRQFTRRETVTGDIHQFGPHGGIGSPGNWGFHLHEADCHAGEWGPTPVPSGPRDCMDIFHLADLEAHRAADGHLLHVGPNG